MDYTSHEGDGRIGRRTFLRRAGASLLAIGTSGTAVAGDFGGSNGSLTAPSDFPLVTARGHFDDEGTLTAGHTRTDFDGAGDWAKYNEASDEEILVFVHGWNIDDSEDADIDAAYTCQRALERNGYDEFVVGFSWDADLGSGVKLGWETGEDIARANGPKLAQWIADWNDRGGDPVRLVAHSLGSQVTMEALAELEDRGRFNAVESVSLIGAAIEDQSVSTDRQYGDAIQYSTHSLSNFYNRDDQVLDWAFGTAELDTAVGLEGIQDGLARPYNYQELNVTESVPDHNSYYEPVDGCMQQLVAQF